MKLNKIKEGIFRLKACSAAVISHYPVSSGCFRLARESSFNSEERVISTSPALKAFKAPDSTESSKALQQYTLHYVKVWFNFFCNSSLQLLLNHYCI